MFGVRDLVCLSLSVESVRCVRAEEGRMSSLCGRPVRIPDQSPETGRVFVNSGEPDKGVKELKLLCLLGTELESTPAPGLVVRLPDLTFPPCMSKSRKSGSERLEVSTPSGTKGGLDAGETNGEVCIASGILSLVSKTKKASPPSASFIA